ncbi:unnamed protein product, partial [Heterotrigona itama]
ESLGDPAYAERGNSARYLSGSLNGELSLSSNRIPFWSLVRSDALRSASVFRFRWIWDPLVCPERDDRRVNIHPATKRQVINRLRAVVAEHNTYALNAKPDQGKVFDATSRHGASNRFSTLVSSTGALCIARAPRRDPLN